MLFKVHEFFIVTHNELVYNNGRNKNNKMVAGQKWIIRFDPDRQQIKLNKRGR